MLLLADVTTATTGMKGCEQGGSRIPGPDSLPALGLPS